MSANVKRIVIEDISNKITQKHILFEAITNAIQANAKRIICRFYSNQAYNKTNEEIFTRKIDSLEIEDDGDGFTDENLRSFKDYRSDHKVDLGCKGVGRLTFLKLFQTVQYTSNLVEQKIQRKFPLDFSLDDIIPEDTPVDNILKNCTVLFLSDITNAYYRKWRNADKRMDLDLGKIKENVLVHLIPTLYFHKNKKTNICIEFIDAETNEKVRITEDDVPPFCTREFSLKDSYNGDLYTFRFSYDIKNENGSLNAFHCANLRTVCSFSDKDLKIGLPPGFSGYFLLESNYLDQNVDNDRNDFNIYPTRTDFDQPFSWETINNELKTIISEIVQHDIPNAIEINKRELQAIQDTRPYLIDYVDEGDIDIAGFIDKSEIIEKAKKRFDIAKEDLLASIGKTKFTDDELQNAIQVVQSELISYINDRILTIGQLKTLVNKRERVEDYIHDLFMAKDTDTDFYAVGKNNLWLLDDRFISYSYAASNRTIKRVLTSQGLMGETPSDSDKPDISLFFPQSPSVVTKDLKSVIIEIKPFDYASKPARKKHAGLVQLRDYIKAFQTQEKIKEIWAFLVTEVDDEFAVLLEDDEFKPLFSTDTPMYFRYYGALNAFIYVVSASTLVADAEARNKAFIDIIKKQSKLNAYISRSDKTIKSQ